MLRSGIKAGQLLNQLILNQLITTAENVANMNVVARIRGLSDGDSTSLQNTIYFHQHRDRLVLINVYVSKTAMTPVSPILVSVKDTAGTNITSSFSEIDDTYDSYNFDKNGESYILYVARRTYSVASAGKTRIELVFDAINSTTKNFLNTKITEGLILQFSSAHTIINKVNEGDTSDYHLINDIKDAFKNRQSYALTCLNQSYATSKVTNNHIFDRLLSVMEDFNEYGVINNTKFDLVKLDSYDAVNNERPFSRAYINNTITAGTQFSYAIVTDTGDNLNKLLTNKNEYFPKNYDSTNKDWATPALYLDTRLSDNFMIASVLDDALNSYDMHHLWRNLTKRLIGMMAYPVIGESIITNEATTGAPVDAGIEIINNVDNLTFSRNFKLTSGFEARFSIV